MNRIQTGALLIGSVVPLTIGIIEYPGWFTWVLGVITIINLAFWIRVKRNTSWTVKAELVFVAVASWLAVVQAQIASDLYDIQRLPIESASGYVVILIIIHFLLINYFFVRPPGRSGISLLQASIVYTSLLYLPTQVTPEAGIPLLVPAVLAIMVSILLSLMRFELHYSIKQSLIFATLGLFGLVGIITTITSYAPGESLHWMFKFAILALLFLEIYLIHLSQTEWKQTLVITLISSLAPILLIGIAKMAQVIILFGILPGLRYRLNIVELGRANLLARELMMALPLAIALRLIVKVTWLRWVLTAMVILGILIFGFTQSAGGVVGVILMLFFSILLTQRGRLPEYLRGRQNAWKLAGSTLLLVLLFIGGIITATQLNIGSFNGRLFQIRASLAEIINHPLLGVGPGVYHVKAQVLNEINWVIDNRITLDNPLFSQQWYQDAATLHAHNLFFEIGVATGLPGLIAFVLFLFLLFRVGISYLDELPRDEGTLFKGLIIALSATIAWGMLDVVQFSTPFFATSGWVLAGLVLSVSHFCDSRKISRSFHPSLLWGFITIVIVLFLGLLGGNWYYRQAYNSLIAQDWEHSIPKLTMAAKWEPLNAKYEQLRGEVYINLGQYERATQAYHRANTIKREYSPYLQQLGWLSVLTGVPQDAGKYFAEAVSVDPNAIWSNDIYSALGIYYAANQQNELALEAFAQELALHPDLASLPHWNKVLTVDRHLDALLDAAYLNLENPDAETQKRALERLGKAELTNQSFSLTSNESKSLYLSHVLDILEQRAFGPNTSNRDQYTLLASLTQASLNAGLLTKAKSYADQFIHIRPQSGFGYLILARIALMRGELGQAHDQVSRALAQNPKNLDALILAANTFLIEGDQTQYVNYVHKAEIIAPFNTQVNQLASQGESIDKIKAFTRLVAVDSSTPVGTALVDILINQNKMSRARAQCKILLHHIALANPPIISDEVKQISTCLTKTAPEDFENLVNAQSRLNRRLMGWVKVSTLDLIGNQEKASATAEELRSEFPERWTSQYMYGLQAQESDESNLAEVSWLRAAELDPQQPLPWEALGNFYVGQGRTSDAFSAYQRAAEIAPNRPEALISLAKFAYQQGNMNLIKDSLEKLLTTLGTFEDGEIINLSEILTSAALVEPSPEFIHPDLIHIYPQPLPAVFMHPTSRLAYDIEMPTVKDDERILFRTFVGMLPESWNQESDGVEFDVQITSASEEIDMLHIQLDPTRKIVDRRWLPVEIDLTQFAGKVITITLQTNPGSAGDNRYDWAVWGNPHFVIDTMP